MSGEVVTVGFSLNLSWPDHALSPNSRAHWTEVASTRKQQREEAYMLTLCALDNRPFQSLSGKPQVALTFHPKDKRRRDLDNVLASLKGALDGISDAIKIDDSDFRVSMEWGDPIRGGTILVKVTA